MDKPLTKDIWQSFWNKDSISVNLVAGNSKVLRYESGHTRTYLRNVNYNSEPEGGVPVTVIDASEDSL